MFKVNNKDTRMTPLAISYLVLVFTLLTLSTKKTNKLKSNNLKNLRNACASKQLPRRV